MFSQIIDFLPYPLAIFTSQYTLVMTNKAFAEETKTRFLYPEKGGVHILQHKINDIQLAAAVRRVFAGETFFLEDIMDPFSMFSGIVQKKTAESKCFRRAVVFPILADDSAITHGVIVFMP